MTVRLVNLTPHPLVVVGPAGPLTHLDPDGPPARVTEIRSTPRDLVTDLGPLPLVAITYADEVAGLPDPEPGIRYLVSRVSAAALAGARNDLVFPLDEVRDERGAIVGCRALGHFAVTDPAAARPTVSAGAPATADVARPGDTREG